MSLDDLEWNDIQQNCEMFGELVVLEMNQIYKLWYGSGPNPKDFISKETDRYLRDYHIWYYERIHGYHVKWRNRFFLLKHQKYDMDTP